MQKRMAPGRQITLRTCIWCPTTNLGTWAKAAPVEVTEIILARIASARCSRMSNSFTARIIRILLRTKPRSLYPKRTAQLKSYMVAHTRRRSQRSPVTDSWWPSVRIASRTQIRRTWLIHRIGWSSRRSWRVEQPPPTVSLCTIRTLLLKEARKKRSGMVGLRTRRGIVISSFPYRGLKTRWIRAPISSNSTNPAPETSTSTTTWQVISAPSKMKKWSILCKRRTRPWYRIGHRKSLRWGLSSWRLTRRILLGLRARRLRKIWARATTQEAHNTRSKLSIFLNKCNFEWTR